MNTAIMYADDLCCFAASAEGLQDLLDVCSNYAKLHDIVFNCKKPVGMIFSSKDMYTFMPCNMNTNGQKIKFVNNVLYLGVSISSDLCDDTDIARQADIYIVQPISSKLVFSNVQLR